MKTGRSQKEEKLAAISPRDRILLISHCLRPSQLCEARVGKQGLECRDGCPNRCTIGRLRILAQKLGYKGVCIAPGGSMALKYIKEKKPKGIVAIACYKELEEGVCAVADTLNQYKIRQLPVIVTVPLTKDGCVDTEVDEEEAERIIRL
ncbi:MAG: DUF116 domain-containing protein [Actinomycetota bacterium]|nr:DUF116 domain-containing protein [Actinomycetota bacterium]